MPHGNARNCREERKNESSIRCGIRRARKFCKESLERCRRSICRLSNPSCMKDTKSNIFRYIMILPGTILLLAIISYATGSSNEGCKEDVELIARFANDQEHCAILSLLAGVFAIAGVCYWFKIKAQPPESSRCKKRKRSKSRVRRSASRRCDSRRSASRKSRSGSRRSRSASCRSRSTSRSASRSASTSNIQNRTPIMIERCCCDSCEKNFKDVPPKIVYI